MLWEDMNSYPSFASDLISCLGHADDWFMKTLLLLELVCFNRMIIIDVEPPCANLTKKTVLAMRRFFHWLTGHLNCVSMSQIKTP